MQAEALRDPLQHAEALNDAGRYGEALVALERILVSEPDNVKARVAGAWALENLGPERLIEARDAYREAVRLDPTELWAKEGLSNVLRRLGHPDEARALCAEVVDEARARQERDDDMLELLGWCEYRLGRFDEAVEVFREALEGDPELLAVRFDHALTLLCAGHGTDALREYRAGLETAASLTRVRGLVAVALDDLDEALAELPDLRTSEAADLAQRLLRDAVSPSVRPDEAHETPRAGGLTWSERAPGS